MAVMIEELETRSMQVDAALTLMRMLLGELLAETTAERRAKIVDGMQTFSASIASTTTESNEPEIETLQSAIEYEIAQILDFMSRNVLSGRDWNHSSKLNG